MVQPKRQKLIPLFILSLFFLMLPFQSLTAKTAKAASSPDAIRVGIFELNGFFEKGEEGQPQGYGRDYLDKLAEKTGWTYEYIWTENWDQSMEYLREGKVDLIAPAGKTQARMDEFAFSSYNIGTECGALLTLSTNDSLVYEDFQAFNNITIGCVKSLIFKPAFGRYASLHGFTPHFIDYKDTKALMAALNAGEVDAALVNLFAKTDTTKVLAKFGAEPFYFMLSQEDSALLEELDQGLQRIKLEDTYLDVELTHQYWPAFHETPFTKSELEYIESSPVLKVGCRSDSMPVSYVNKETGTVEGMTRDILDQISQTSGFTFEYIALPKGTITYDYLRENQISLIANVEYNQENANAAGVKLTMPYLNSKKVFVCNKTEDFDTQAPLKLAVSTGSQTLSNAIHAVYPNFQVMIYPSMEDCFKAVRSGEAHILLQNQYVVTPYLAKPVYSHMVTIPTEGLEDNLCLSPVLYQKEGEADSFLTDDRLISILNKSIQKISEHEISKIIIKETAANQYRQTLGDFLYQYRYFLILITIILAVLAGILLYTVSVKRKSMMLVTKNEAKLRHITNNINGGVVVLTATDQLIITYANEGFLDLLQCSKEEYSQIKNQEYITYVHPDNVEELKSLMSMDIRERSQMSIKLRIMRKDGTYIPALFNGTITENQKGERKIYCVIMDFSQQEQLLETISLEQKKYSALIEYSGDIIFELDYKNTSLMVSPVFQKKFGWKLTPNSHINQFHDIPNQLKLWDEDWEQFEESMAQVWEEKESTDCTVRIRKKSGDFLWCRIFLYPMSDTAGNLVCILGKILDVNEEFMEKQALKQKSRTDELTGLLNKNAFFEEAQDYLTTGTNKNTALVFIDVDNFKQVNDTLGHMAGDKAIQDTARKLQIIFSSYDILSRFGGDEFCILLKEIPVEALSEKLSWAVEKLRVTYSDGGNGVKCTASIGAVHTHGQAKNLETLLEHADQALYRAKENGKDQYMIY